MQELPGKRVLVSTLSTNIVIQILTMVSGILVARALGPEGRGLMAGAQILPTIFATVALLGLNNVFAIRAAKNKIGQEQLSPIALRIGFIASIVGVCVAWFILPYCIPDTNGELLYLSKIS